MTKDFLDLVLMEKFGDLSESLLIKSVLGTDALGRRRREELEALGLQGFLDQVPQDEGGGSVICLGIY